MIDPREIRKNKVLNDMRKEIQEMDRFKRSPEGKRAFMIKWMDDNFGKNNRRASDERS